MESFRDLDGKRSAEFARLPIEGARPGDLVTLDAAPGGTFGHNVVVYRNDGVDASRRAALIASYGTGMAAFLASPGPHRALEVDASWGAGTSGGIPHARHGASRARAGGDRSQSCESHARSFA